MRNLAEKDIQYYVNQAKAGDKDALVYLYRNYVEEIYFFLLKRSAGKEEAEDLTSQTFLKMITALPGFAGKSTFKNWLYAIAKNTLMDSWRSRYRTRTVPLEEFLELDVTADDSIYDTTNSKKYMEKLHKILNELPKDYREVINCRFFESLSLKETAERMGKTVGNIKVIQYRAVQKAAELAKNI